MVAAVTTDSSQLAVLSASQVSGGDVVASQFAVMAAATYPAEFAYISQFSVSAATEFDINVDVSQLGILVAARGRITDPKVRAWTFTLDGHDFYVLRLGNIETLVYDTAAQQWYLWGFDTSPLWKAYNGTNWLAADSHAFNYGSNIVVGDDANGSLYFLDPDRDVDDDAVEGEAIQRPFQRVVTTQYPIRGYSQLRCYGINLYGSIGGPLTDPSLNTVTLSYSDDRGVTYLPAGSVTMENESYDQRIDWRSLGSMRAPGRLFKIEDTGALRRIDAIDITDDSVEG